MTTSDDFQRRIGYFGDIKPLLAWVCSDFSLGAYLSYSVVEMGYEDFNLVLMTKKGKFFVKLYAASRTDTESKRSVDVMLSSLKNNVQLPKLYKSNQGYFYQTDINNIHVRLCVMDFIDGKTYFELKAKPTLEEKKFLINEAVKINKIQIKPTFIHDSWAIVNFKEQFTQKGKYLEKEDKEIIDVLYNDFLDININNLPHSFVHGDIIDTNVMKDTNGKLYIIDFSVSNYYPRIVELAVLLCSLFFDEKSLENTKVNYELAVTEYQKYLTLTSYEIQYLPLFIKIGHAMYVISANYEKVVNKNTLPENEYWLRLGKAGLRLLNQ